MSALENLLLKKYKESVVDVPARTDVSAAKPESKAQSSPEPEDLSSETANDPGSVAGSDDSQGYLENGPSLEEEAKVSSEPTDEIHWTVEIAVQAPLVPELQDPQTSISNDGVEEYIGHEAPLAEVVDVGTELNEDRQEPLQIEAKSLQATKVPTATPASSTDAVVAQPPNEDQPAILEVAIEPEVTDAAQDLGEAVTEATQPPEARATGEATRGDQPEQSGSEEPEHEPKSEPDETPTFKAQWEVDRFLWPDFFVELEAEIAADLSDAVQHIQVEFERQSIDAVLITAAQRGSGRTTMTLCLAREAARQGKSVVIMDLDHQQPALVKQLGVGVEEGIESLGPTVRGDSICVKAVEDGVTLVPLASPINSTQCLEVRVQDLLALVAASHDLVLIDASADVAELLSSSPLGLRFGTVVVDDKRVAANVFRNEIIDRVRGENCHSIGIIENFAA